MKLSSPFVTPVRHPSQLHIAASRQENPRTPESVRPRRKRAADAPRESSEFLDEFDAFESRWWPGEAFDLS